MRLLQGSAFFDIFHTSEHFAFHLEVEDSYHTPSESEPFRRFLRGEVDDFQWHQPWLDLVREVTATGRRIERIRIVSVPHVDYSRWGLTVAPLNIAAGEDIRWLPRHLLHGIDVTADDFWLIDDRRVVFTVFTSDGTWSGGAETTDSKIVDRCVRVRNTLGKLAIPHADYVR
ncbi:hypothetical protein FHR83_003495 [Actinoplanes campanulatus]|uniref:DUF6879 domain-containing protein n=1 Tax=Actinoplanes campanulatus TaxID=113559 RepID=A0A7W5AGV1_9ACTN|nr:DUF6879 family protein [Actinoplanes campanulatus]MBB3095825.1 hypothetical protein [Actinoplanes campanulatus]GGN11859.1 hypothetical protein GCM10010109_22080 [Actinoplanes campanulatus]GID37080.1 hypothetical protein Aca09nite_35860 [Actinoplanes campanulatus]